MRKKRFYKNVKRNQKWTEDVQGRRIDFADKYADGGIYSDKFDYLRPKKKSRSRKLEAYRRIQKLLKLVPILILAFAMLNLGYAGMSVYMKRNAMPDISGAGEYSQGGFNSASLELNAQRIEIASLDGSDILNSVLSQAQEDSYNGVAFDIKRSDGTVSYKSSLANIDAFGATAFAANDLPGSAAIFEQRNIFAVGIVYCYLDGLAPSADGSMAVLNDDGSLYEDSRGNTYLNPDSELAYSYIRDIIAEIYGQGVSVFLLRGLELPDDISGSYNDGFEALAKRLYGDIGTDIKLLEAVDISIDEDDLNNISEIISNDLNDSQTYYITTSADKALTKEKLEESGISSYILVEQ
ncbi:MAG: hypothetical protein J1E05_05375 [Eubacterium sp.]|nr:hypothetical protein [Eubacterium sp.]